VPYHLGMLSPSAPGPGKRLGRTDALFLAVIAGLGIWLRLRIADFHPPWFDEVALWLQAVSSNQDSADGPLTIALSRAALLLHDDWMALHWAPAVLGGLACVPAGLLGLKVSGEQRVGILVALLHGLAPLGVFLSGQARPYGILMFFEALALCAFAEALTADRARDWVFFGLTSVLMVNVHLLGLVVLAGLATGAALAWCLRWVKFSWQAGWGLSLSLLAAPISLPLRLLARGRGGEISGLPASLLEWLGQSFAAWVAPVSAVTPNFPIALLCVALLGLGGVAAARRRNPLLLCLVSTAVLAQGVTAVTIGHKAQWTMAERYVSHGLTPFLVTAAWLLVSREITLLARARALLACFWLIYSASWLPALFTRPSLHDVEERVLIEAHQLLSSMDPRATGIVLESYRSAAHFRLIGESPAPVWVKEGGRVRLVQYGQGLAGPPAVPQLQAAPFLPGTYLLLGRLSQPSFDCASLAERSGLRGHPSTAPIGVLCVLDKPRP